MLLDNPIIELFLRDVGECHEPGLNGVTSKTRHDDVRILCTRTHISTATELLDLFLFLRERLESGQDTQVKLFFDHHQVIFGADAYEKFMKVAGLVPVSSVPSSERTNRAAVAF